MGKAIGYFLGWTMLVSGLVYLVRPRLGFSWWETRVSPHLPGSYVQVEKEYLQLSDSALRYMDGWYAALGVFLIWLASKARS